MAADTYDLETRNGRRAYLRDTCDLEVYLTACETAAIRSPSDVATMVQYADAIGMGGDVAKKESLLRDILSAYPTDTLANLTLGLELLRQGRHRDAWPHYLYRFGMKNVVVPDPGLPTNRRWQGEAVGGKRLCLVREQGLGDTIQFLRFGMRLRDDGAQTFLNVQPALRRLLDQSPAAGKVLFPGRQVDVHHWVYMMELIPVFAPTAADVLWEGPYVAAPAQKAPIHLPISTRDALRVGLCWRGNPRHAGDQLRSMQLEHLRPLRELTGCAFYSLMPPTASEEITQEGDWVKDIASLTSPFEKLAKAVSQMDVVVSVCTSIAHLAAAMGKPTMILLSSEPDWRWGRDSATTPWYPSCTLLRQTRLGDWTVPVEDLRNLLAKL